MSPRFYGFLWIVFAVSAAILSLGGVFTMLTAVIFGFIAFGLVFTGMMCVLPGNVSHPSVNTARDSWPESDPEPAARENAAGHHMHVPLGLRFH